MRILGIDPGSRKTGVGIIELHPEHTVVVCYGVIQVATGKSKPGDFPDRLGRIFNGISDLVREHRPDVAAVETVFIAKNPNSAIKLGQARGAAVCAAINGGLEVAEYSPRLVKQAIVGRGGADKVQVQHMVRVLLGLKEVPEEDAADALAVALCHHHTRGTLDNMAAAKT